MQRDPPEGGISLSRGAAIYAILRSGGRQFRVQEGRTVRVPRIDAEEGARLELPDVLLLARDDGEVTVGAPLVDGARVIAEVASQGRDKKITVFKYKSKVRYRRKRGHRQAYTELRVQRILGPGEAEAVEEAPRRQRRKAAPEPEAAPAAEATAEAAEAGAKPRSRRARAGATPSTETPATEERPKRARAKKRESTSSEEGEA